MMMNNGRKSPDYRRNCTAECTGFALKTMRSFVCSLYQTMHQTMYQTIYQTMCETISRPISIFARDSARDLTHFQVTRNV